MSRSRALAFAPHAAVREQHELLDQLVALEVGAALDLDRLAALVHPRLDLGNVEVQGARGQAAPSQGARQPAQLVERPPEGRRERPVPVERLLDLAVVQAMPAPDHGLLEADAEGFTLRVELG